MLTRTRHEASTFSPCAATIPTTTPHKITDSPTHRIIVTPVLPFSLRDGIYRQRFEDQQVEGLGK